MRTVDVLILGSGPAGQMPAYAAAAAGLGVVVVENATPGGTCAHRCGDAAASPLRAAAAAHEARAWSGGGLGAAPGLDLPALRRWTDGFTDPVGADTRRSLAAAGVELVEAEPAFTGEDTARVGEEAIRFGRAAVCTGRVPGPAPFPGADLATDAAGFLALETVPEHLVVVGGGWAGMQLACLAAVAGSRVTVLEAAETPLRRFDAEAARVVVAGMNRLGVRGTCGRQVTGLEAAAPGVRVLGGAGHPTLEADLVVLATPRVPATTGLDLEAAGIQHGTRGIRVDRHLQTTNPRVYAGGDVADTGNPRLTPNAARDGRVLRRNLIHDGAPRTHLRPEPPRSTLAAATIPPIARTGYTEAEARAHPTLGPIDVASGDASGWKRMRQRRAPDASYKFVYAGSDAANDRRLVGAHVVGPGAEEAINLFATGLHDPAATARLSDTSAAFPSFGFNLLNAFRAGL